MKTAQQVGESGVARELQGETERLARCQQPSGQPRTERLPLEQLLDDIGSVLVGSDVVDDGEVRVIEDACRPGLLLEATKAIRIRGKGGRQYLDRHLAPESRIPRPVNLTHSSRPERCEHFIGSEPAPC